MRRVTAFLHNDYTPRFFYWELLEMLRRLTLVGLFVVIEPGTVIQSFMGMIFCACYLLVQLISRPYANGEQRADPRSRNAPLLRPERMPILVNSRATSVGDDYLALASSFSLLVLFMCTILYKYDELTASTDVQDKMSLEQKEKYLFSSLLLSAILVASVIGALVAACAIVFGQAVVERSKVAAIRKLRYVADSTVVELPRLRRGSLSSRAGGHDEHQRSELDGNPESSREKSGSWRDKSWRGTSPSRSHKARGVAATNEFHLFLSQCAA